MSADDRGAGQWRPLVGEDGLSRFGIDECDCHVAVGVLSLIMSPGEAAALVVIPALITNIWQGWFGSSFMPLIRRLWPTLLASFLGTFVATWAGLGLLTPDRAPGSKKGSGCGSYPAPRPVAA